MEWNKLGKSIEMEFRNGECCKENVLVGVFQKIGSRSVQNDSMSSKERKIGNI